MPLSRWNLNLKSTWRVLQTLQRLLRRQLDGNTRTRSSLPPPIDEPDTDDPEVLRQRAAARRKAEDQARKLELEARRKRAPRRPPGRPRKRRVSPPQRERDRKAQAVACRTVERGCVCSDEMSCVVDPGKGGWSGVAFPVRAVSSVDITSR